MMRNVAFALTCALAVAPTALATQHLVRAGDDWSKLASKLQPGDDIVLMPGKHKGASFDNLAGAPGKPISIRPADPMSPVTIEADDVGISLKNPKHVRIESVVIVGAKRTGVLIEGTASTLAEDVLLRSVYVAKTGDRGDKDAIRIVHATGVVIDRARVEGWHRAGIHVTASHDVTIKTTEFVGAASTPDLYAIAIDGGSDTVSIDRGKFGMGITIAVAIGIADTDTLPELPESPAPAAESPPKSGPAKLPALADTVIVEKCIADRPKRFVAFGACRNVMVRGNTVLSPGALWEVAAAPKGWCAPAEVTLISNLVWWEPGTMQAFSIAAPGAEVKGVGIEANLWWSAEISAARNLLGEFVGTMKSPQLTDLDPQLDNYYVPRDEKAKAFGTNAP